MAYCQQSDLEAVIGKQQLAELTNDTPNQYTFTVSGIVTAPAVANTYSNNGLTLTIVSLSLTNGAGTIVAAAPSGSATAPLSAGVLTRVTGNGDASISYSAVSASDPTIIAAMITQADNEIDAKAGQVYNVPFTPGTNCTSIPTEIFQISVAFAVYYCFLRRIIIVATPKAILNRYNEAMANLEAVSNQQLNLDDGNPTIASSETMIETGTEDPQAGFYDPTGDNPLSSY